MKKSIENSTKDGKFMKYEKKEKRKQKKIEKEKGINEKELEDRE